MENIKKVIDYFVKYRFMTQSDNTLTINNAWTVIEGEEIEIVYISPFAKTVETDKMSVFWPYIIAMLQNMGSLSIDRIHSLLGMILNIILLI